jgi:hypothetical protein
MVEMRQTDSQRFESIQERDVDLLLLEELSISPAFRTWWLRELGQNPDMVEEFVGAWHSVFDPKLGESDIEFGVTVKDNTRLLVMIENKIDAPFQNEQLERYQKRGQKATSNKWDEFRTCLIAPETYLSGFERTDTVDTTLTYESIHQWFAEYESRRSKYRAEMLQDAIDQGRRGYVAKPDEQVTAFHRYYWTIARDDFPELGMGEPDGVPSGNPWVRFKPSALPSDVKLIHKTIRGHIDLQFSGMAEQADAFREEYEPLLEQNMQIAQTRKSMSVRIIVHPLSSDENPKEQEAGIKSGLASASQLLSWYEQTDHNPPA